MPAYYSPEIEPGAVIAIRVESGYESLREGLDLVELEKIPDLGVGDNLLLFLQSEGSDPPPGFTVDTYYRLMRSSTDSQGMVTGHLVPDGGFWAHPDATDAVSQSEFEDLIVEHAHLVPPDCLGFWTAASFAGIDSIYELVEKAEVVIKARTDSDSSEGRFAFSAEVLDVLVGEVTAEEVVIDGGETIGYYPGLGTCDYYLFLTSAGLGVVTENSERYSLRVGGAQGAFVVHAGVVQQVWPSLGDRYRGMSEEEFVGEILEGAEWAAGNDE
jgi:hypothetical protein